MCRVSRRSMLQALCRRGAEAGRLWQMAERVGQAVCNTSEPSTSGRSLSSICTTLCSWATAGSRLGHCQGSSLLPAAPIGSISGSQTASWGPGSRLQLVRGLFGAPSVRPNLQIHTHDRYKTETPQPTYEWMLGRFVMDRNGTVWHRQANRRAKRYHKSPGTLGRLARWKPLANAYAAKFRKLPGVRERLRYWNPPDPRSVPGFQGSEQPYRPPPRRRDKLHKRPGPGGDPALVPH